MLLHVVLVLCSRAHHHVVRLASKLLGLLIHIHLLLHLVLLLVVLHLMWVLLLVPSLHHVLLRMLLLSVHLAHLLLLVVLVLVSERLVEIAKIEFVCVEVSHLII